MWIDASEELPMAGQDVLCCCVDGDSNRWYTVAHHNGEWWANETYSGIPVTHWQPLPSAPSERKPSEPEQARRCGKCEQWKNGVCILPKSPRFTDTTSATDGCTPAKKARADWI